MSLRMTCAISFYYGNSHTHCGKRVGTIIPFREREETERYGTTCPSMGAAPHRDSSCEIASSWTSKLRTQFVSLTLGMGIIIEHINQNLV